MTGVKGSVFKHKLLNVRHARLLRREAFGDLAAQKPTVWLGLQKDELAGNSHVREFLSAPWINAPHRLFHLAKAAQAVGGKEEEVVARSALVLHLKRSNITCYVPELALVKVV